MQNPSQKPCFVVGVAATASPEYMNIIAECFEKLRSGEIKTKKAAVAFTQKAVKKVSSQS